MPNNQQAVKQENMKTQISCGYFNEFLSLPCCFALQNLQFTYSHKEKLQGLQGRMISNDNPMYNIDGIEQNTRPTALQRSTTGTEQPAKKGVDGVTLALIASVIWASVVTALLIQRGGDDASGSDRLEMSSCAQEIATLHENVRQDFTFVASYVNSTRQYGKCLNFIVKYRYLPSAEPVFFDYRALRDTALYYSEPTADLPMMTYWENINVAFVANLTARYSSQIQGMSSEIQVMNSITPAIQEAGNHGSIYSTGNIEPSTQPWTNNFLYDCTKTTGPS